MKLFNFYIYRHSLPHGTNLFADLDKVFGLKNFKVVFDVGANEGQSAIEYNKTFSFATIYSFEPVAKPYYSLQSLSKSMPRVNSYHMGMGRNIETAEINVNPLSRVNSILHSRHDDHQETIQLNTIADFCGNHQISNIDFLKIDTEGYELEVLEGARSLLEKQSIKTVIAECSPDSDSNYFVSFKDLNTYLSALGYELFGIYEQQLHWDGRKSILFFNALFVSRQAAVS